MMGWDNQFFTNRKEVFENQKALNEKGVKEKNISRRCSGCNKPLGIASTTLYEIDEKYYCSECYFRTITNQAVERDHSDIRMEKKGLKRAVP